MQQIRQFVTPFVLFLRFEYLIFAFMLPILGAASVQQSLDTQQVLWLLASAFCFHVFISLQNDIVDLPLDCTDPRRKDYPLVKGSVSLKFASVITLFQIPLVLALSSWWGMSDLVVVAIILILGMMSVYNIWGKRTKFPIFTDFAQGIGFAGLVLFGAASSGNLTLFSAMAFWGVVIWMMQTNQLGGIRDLQSDYFFDTSTTPIFLGSKYGRRGYFISKKCMLYSYLLLLIQFALPLTFLRKDEGLIDPGVLALLVTVILLVFIIAASTLYKFFEIVSKQFRLEFDLAYVVMYLSAVPVLALLALTGNRWVIVATSVVITASIRTYHRVIKVIS